MAARQRITSKPDPESRQRLKLAMDKKAPPPLRHEERDWGRIYIGTREQLIDGGFARPGWFPGDLDYLTKRVYYIGLNAPNGCGEVEKVKKIAAPFYQVSIRAFVPNFSDPETLRIDSLQPEEEAALPGTIAEHREKLFANVTDWERFAQCYLDDEGAFYRLSATDQQKLSEAWTHIRSIIHNATIRPRKFGVIEGGFSRLVPNRHQVIDPL